MPAEACHWVGSFSPGDRAEIEHLRAGQAEAIEQRDAAAYARLCTEDILLIFPGHDVVQGQRAFVECETNLFRGGRSFDRVRKQPVRVERSGDLAFEIGRHALCATTPTASEAQVIARRKYLHVMRKTAAGWRFAVLTSNHSADPGKISAKTLNQQHT